MAVWRELVVNMTYADGKILAEVIDGVGVITFNQPEKHNAMSAGMWRGTEEALIAWENDDAVRVLVITGAGEKAFISGADISEFATLRSAADAQAEYDRATSAGRARLASFPKPVIARIGGWCLGGGLAVAMQADIRIATEGSTFGIPAARLGLAYGFDMVQTLVSLVGAANARRLLFTGERINATEALRIGLVNQMVANDKLTETVDALTRTIADNAPLTIHAAKLAVRQTLLSAAERDTAAIAAAVAACYASADYKEGRAAFAEKRSPKFQGK